MSCTESQANPTRWSDVASRPSSIGIVHRLHCWGCVQSRAALTSGERAFTIDRAGDGAVWTLVTGRIFLKSNLCCRSCSRAPSARWRSRFGEVCRTSKLRSNE